MKHNFIALEQEIWAATTRDIDAPQGIEWETDYLYAIEMALLVFDQKPLLKLLRDKRPIHPMLLPALADAIEAKRRPSGNRRKLTATQELVMARAMQYERRKKGKLKEEVVEDMAALMNLSESTVKRAYDKHIDIRIRPNLRFTIR